MKTTDIYSVEPVVVAESDLAGREERSALARNAKHLVVGDEGFGVMLTRIENGEVFRRAEWIFVDEESAKGELEFMMQPEARRSLGGRNKQVLFAQ